MADFRKICFFFPCPIQNFPIFAPVNPRENGLMKKAHFSLYSIIVKLGHFCCKSWNKEKMNASIGL